MTSNSDLLEAAQLAEAAYATLLNSAGSPLTSTEEVVAALKRVGLSETQAVAFAANYRVIHQQPNTATGFSATFGRANRFTPRHDQVAIGRRSTNRQLRAGAAANWLDFRTAHDVCNYSANRQRSLCRRCHRFRSWSLRGQRLDAERSCRTARAWGSDRAGVSMLSKGPRVRHAAWFRRGQ